MRVEAVERDRNENHAVAEQLGILVAEFRQLDRASARAILGIERDDDDFSTLVRE